MDGGIMVVMRALRTDFDVAVDLVPVRA